MLTVKQLRESDIKSLDDLKPYIYFLCRNMIKMSYGEFSAYKSAIERKSRELGIDYQEINRIAEQYQVYGY